MVQSTRRDFLGGLGKGMLAVGLGPVLASEIGLAAWLDVERPASGDGERLTFGEWEPLVSLLQETTLAELMPALVEKLRGGADLKTLVGAALLANSRTFGGHDYEGYHAFMALVPSYDMAQLAPDGKQALPVLKVLYRNTARIHAFGGSSAESLRALAPQPGAPRAESLHAAMVSRDREVAEQRLAALCAQGAEQAYGELQRLVQENLDVHRTVIAWRAWDAQRLLGAEHALTLMRQSLRYCLDGEATRVERGRPEPELRALLPELLEESGLTSAESTSQRASDAELAEWSRAIAEESPEQAARLAAALLAKGISPDDVGEAMSLAANALLLRDPGSETASSFNRQKGSVHGASVGVHASDAARAWRNIARVTGPRDRAASLIAGAYHTAGQTGRIREDPIPYREASEELRDLGPAELLAGAREAIEAGDQLRTCALVHALGERGADPRAVFDLLLEHAISQDGALHAEKYFSTTWQEFHEARPAFRWTHLVGLGRIAASQQGVPAPGYAEACELLKS